VLAEATESFNRAFERWRELYSAALRERDEAHRARDRARTRREQEQAERRRAEAERERDLLLNRREEAIESDFYPYRYLASEGFLPGYNFPRLPLRALVRVGNETHAVDRPRLLGIAEFGPNNLLYHEGRKFRIRQVVLPSTGIDARMTSAMLCRSCGFFHEGATPERCEHCGTELTGDTSEYVSTLFDMPVSRARPADRITSNEEERIREGYELATYYRFAPRPDGRFLEERAVAVREGRELLELVHGPQATLWRINNGWRRLSDS